MLLRHIVITIATILLLLLLVIHWLKLLLLQIIVVITPFEHFIPVHVAILLVLLLLPSCLNLEGRRGDGVFLDGGSREKMVTSIYSQKLLSDILLGFTRNVVYPNVIVVDRACLTDRVLGNLLLKVGKPLTQIYHHFQVLLLLNYRYTFIIATYIF
jgi:hypothetical protein